VSDFARDKRWLLEINESGKFVVFGNLVSPSRDYSLDVSELPEAKAIKIVGLLCELQDKPALSRS